ncbi:hypothetical protein RvY_05792 [Ramazzottius varieornatus]|uniref:Uncharacterized protein n=1 Tax=Ramazzottius varieornatus TaxID=947166 RepID=A0A1D1V5Z5_RAMVA|nr:hypothetical protein RvY_05792 [Ramazzottius varieornatus]
MACCSYGHRTPQLNDQHHDVAKSLKPDTTYYFLYIACHLRICPLIISVLSNTFTMHLYQRKTTSSSSTKKLRPTPISLQYWTSILSGVFGLAKGNGAPQRNRAVNVRRRPKNK